MKRLIATLVGSLIFITLQTASPAIADSTKSWNYSDQYLSSEVTISQEGDASGDKFTQGNAAVTFYISNLKPKFVDVVDINQDTFEYDAVQSPNPNYRKVIPNYVSEQGALFVASVDIFISDNQDFSDKKSKTFFFAAVDIAMGPSGNVLIDNYRSRVIVQIDDQPTVETRLDSFLEKSSVGYSFQLPVISLKSTGTLFVQTRTSLYESYSLTADGRINGAYSLSYKKTSTSIELSKLGQDIIFTTPKPVPLRNKLARITFSSTSSLPVFSEETDSSICIVDKNLVHFINSGSCDITLSQPGNEFFEAAPEKTLTLTILPDEKKSTITCIKGKVTKKVTAVKPKCPAGYKKK